MAHISFKAPYSTFHGVSLPPLQGNSNCGAFSTFPLNNSYTQEQVEGAIKHRSALRIAVNPPSVSDTTAWRQTYDIVRWTRNKGAVVVLCMWGCNTEIHCRGSAGNGHGSGRILDEHAAREMWRHLGQVFGHDIGVFFEAFNEPFGYKNPNEYMELMLRIVQDLPADRVIIDGLGYADDVQCIKNLWPGFLAYHVYPNWLPAGKRTQRGYSQLIQKHLSGVAHRVFVTEFGCNLKLHGENYNDSSSASHHVQFLKGVHDAFGVMKPRGTFVWHGWNNGDSYCFWQATGSARSKLDRIQSY